MRLPLLPDRPTCILCPLHTSAKSVGIRTLYLEDSLPPAPGTPALVWVGQNPGFNEDRDNEPFVGKSGVLFRGGWYRGKHFPSGSYVDGHSFRTLASNYVSNTVRCWTPDNAKPGWLAHTVPCFPHLLTDLHSIALAHRSITLVCLGEVSSVAVLRLLCKIPPPIRQRDAFRLNGRTYTAPTAALDAPPTASYSVTVFHTYHPAKVDRDPNAIHAVDRHLLLVKNHLTGLETPASNPILVPAGPPPCQSPRRTTTSASTRSASSAPAPPRRSRSPASPAPTGISPDARSRRAPRTTP